MALSPTVWGPITPGPSPFITLTIKILSPRVMQSLWSSPFYQPFSLQGHFLITDSVLSDCTSSMRCGIPPCSPLCLCTCLLRYYYCLTFSSSMLKVLPPSSDEFHRPSMGKRTTFAPERMDRETVKTLPEGFCTRAHTITHIHIHVPQWVTI